MDVGTPPGHLSAASKRVWAALTEEYDFTAPERTTLLLGLEAADRASTARRKLRDEGLTVTTSRGTPAPHPAVAIANQSTTVWLKCLNSLGLDEAEEDRTPSQSRRTRSGRFGNRSRG